MYTMKKIIFCILVLQVVWIAAAEKPKQGKSRGPHQPLKTRNATIARKVAKTFQDVSRLYPATPGVVNAMGLLMESGYAYGYYELYDYAYILNFSPYCFVTRADDLADETYPTTLYTDYFHTLFVYGDHCDINYHFQSVYFNEVNFYDDSTYAHNIALVKTKKQVIYDTRCKNPPLEPAWLSCDPQGPPTNYTDCYMASFGPTKQEQDANPEDLQSALNTLKVKTLSAGDCATLADESPSDLAYDSNDQICATTTDGKNGLCYDENSFLFCKYWGNTNTGWGSSNSGWGSSHNGWKSNESSGWSSNSKPSSHSNNGWGWKPKRQNLLAVGHMATYYAEDDEDCEDTTDDGVTIHVKYGSKTYRDLFAKCGYLCSSDLKPGYRCRDNPPKELGPVYCYPEKIPSHGWSSDSQSSGSGWKP